MTEDYLFVYGTLRRGCNNAMAAFLARHSDFIDNATYQGLLYRVSYYPGLIAPNHAGDCVKGEVYQLHDVKTVLSRLDNYEECGQNHLPPTEYLRRQDWVKLKSGKTVLAWLYFYNYSIHGLELIQSGDFFEIM